MAGSTENKRIYAKTRTLQHVCVWCMELYYDDQFACECEWEALGNSTGAIRGAIFIGSRARATVCAVVAVCRHWARHR